MKLLVCLFLIVMIVEQYNCAPYSTTRNRHRHHHRLQHRPFGQRSSYLPSYGPNVKCRPEYRAWVGMGRAHPWHSFRHCILCSAHDYRRSYGYGYPSMSGYGYHPSFRNCYGSGSRYPTRAHYVPNATSMDELLDKTEDKSLTVEKTTEKDVYKITEKPVEKATQMPVENATQKLIENATQKPVEKTTEKDVDKITEKPVENATQKVVEKITEEDVDKITEKLMERPTEKPVENPSATITDSPINQPSTNSAKSSSENLSEYSTANPFNDWPTEDLIDVTTENPFTY